MAEREDFDPGQTQVIGEPIDPDEQERREKLVQEISSMVPEEIEQFIKPVLEEGELRPGIDYDLAKGVAIGVVEKGKAKDREDALLIGAIARIEGKKILGNLGVQEVVLDNKGNVIAAGSDRISALRKAEKEIES